jgi:CHAD domain-containing protein
VAVRRTRAGLNQLKNVLPEAETARFSEYFAWLGQITTQTRDLDVYLLNFDHYKQSLPVPLQEDLNPLYDFLCLKKKQAQKAMAKKLKSSEHIPQLIAWEQLLKTPAINKPVAADALLPIKALADIRIWKVFRRVVESGKRITDQSPAEELHKLRKTCKKLRYLMEFFQNLYPEKHIKPLINNLKDFQEILGDFQDLAVQEQSLKNFSEEMIHSETPAKTLLAMGVLIENLENRRNQARAAFSSRFETFDREEIETMFKALFKT